ncbi:MAG TPA: hypothetical protein VLV76_09585 [Candidatus Acidoferrum sp.]|nr:hypothetical protein [Candidatus Acidoferrum sp.]
MATPPTALLAAPTRPPDWLPLLAPPEASPCAVPSSAPVLAFSLPLVPEALPVLEPPLVPALLPLPLVPEELPLVPEELLPVPLLGPPATLILLPGSADAARVLRVAPASVLALWAAPLGGALPAVCEGAGAAVLADSRKMLLVSGEPGSVSSASAGADADAASFSAGSGAVSAALLGGGAAAAAAGGSGGSRSRLAGAFHPAAGPLPAPSAKEMSGGTVTVTDMSLVGATAARAVAALSALSGAYQSE